jgi:hypothetical protein
MKFTDASKLNRNSGVRCCERGAPVLLPLALYRLVLVRPRQRPGQVGVRGLVFAGDQVAICRVALDLLQCRAL